MLLNFLHNHSMLGADFQCRVKWQEKSVIVFDVSYRIIFHSHTSDCPSNVSQNRVTAHTALLDSGLGRRYLARITPLAEKPFESPFEGN